MAVGGAYEQRYCAFIDILGFSSLIDDIRRQSLSFTEVRDLLRTVHEPTNKFQTQGIAINNLRATSISDAIAISVDASGPGLVGLVYTVSMLALDVLEAGYFVRGGVCRGPLYHDQDLVFGEALVSAYQMESNIARFPRVMVAKQVYDEALASDLHKFLGPRLKQALDGPYFIDIMAEVRVMLAALETDPETFSGIESKQLPRYETMRANIERRLADAADDPNHFEKAQWFARYWNEGLGSQKRVGKVKGPGMNIVTWTTNG